MGGTNRSNSDLDWLSYYCTLPLERRQTRARDGETRLVRISRTSFIHATKKTAISKVMEMGDVYIYRETKRTDISGIKKERNVTIRSPKFCMCLFAINLKQEHMYNVKKKK
jgi:hypothetical protein